MSLTQIIHRGRSMYGQRTALVYGDRTTSYGQLYDEVVRCAAVFAGFDSRPAARVGILSGNCDRAIIGFFGAVWAGMVPNYLNVRWSLHELQESIDDFQPSILVSDDNFLDMAVALKELCPSIEHILHIGSREDLPGGVHAYEESLQAAEPLEDCSGEQDDLALLNYTGGTTGRGKGVMHSHATHFWTLTMLVAERFFVPGRTLMATPLFHITGIGISNASLMTGSTLYILPAFEPVAVLATIQDNKIEQLLLVPTMWKMVLHHPSFKDYDLGSLRNIRYGASPMDEKLLMEMRAAMPGVDFMQAYGQTEGVPATLLHDTDHSPEGVAAARTRSAGTVALGVEVEIRDPEGMALPTGEIGEITLRGPQLMIGYLNQPEQSATAVRDGWLYTGDAGYLTKDGYLHIADRVKDMIISGGENVYSVEVEAAIHRHEAIEQCAIIGLADEQWGERVHAEIVVTPGQTLTEEELRDHCRPFLAGFKLPRSVKVVESLPLTAAGKIDKVAIRNRYSE